ncbi:MAG: hypothetical protein D6679_06090 [Candidatus Hydrogenedentota bacterium]|nr:MAG: hypothetical protein D6679_06090 [Candidatus Hydrogenedentota bacterium]
MELLVRWGESFESFVGGIASAPTANTLMLFRFIIFLMTVLFIAGTGLQFGSLLLSVLFDLSDHFKRDDNHAGFAERLAGVAGGTIALPVIFGLLPLMTIALCYSRVYYGGTALLPAFFLAAAVFCAVAGILARLFCKTVPLRGVRYRSHIAYGIAALMLYLGMYHIYAAGAVLALTPEKWPFVTTSPHQTFLSWNTIFRFKELVVFAVLFAAVTLRIGYFAWPEGEMAKASEEERRFAGFVLGWWGFVFNLAYPAILLLYLINLPPGSIRREMFTVLVATLLLLHPLVMYSFATGRRCVAKRPVASFILVFLVLLLGVTNQTLAESRANVDRLSLLRLEAGEAEKERETVREAKAEEGKKIDGKEVFQRVCSACHKFDARLVGPPLAERIPKYKGKQEELEKFLANPVKKDPAYPPMPKPAVTPDERKAVAEYLLETLAK